MNNINCGIITHYDVHNHGAVLQLFALIKVLRKDFNIEAKALTFEKNYDFIDQELKSKYELSLKSIPIYLKYLKERGIGAMVYNIRKRQTLEHFRSKENIIGQHYRSYKALQHVIIGSDEVFALHTGPTPVFYGHALPTKKVFSYAGSFGPTNLEDVYNLNCDSLVKSGFQRMSGISVRDQNSKDIVRSITGMEVPVVVDPVLLYGYCDEISGQSRHISDKYLIVYAYDRRMNDAKEVEAIKEFAHQKGLTIVSPGFYHKWVDKNINVDPIELLGWFKHAEYVITDTFHGSVISLITNRPFSVIVRDNSNKVINLLREYNLESRVVGVLKSDLLVHYDNVIDYATTNDIIKEKRSTSMHYLKEQLSKNEQ